MTAPIPLCAAPDAHGRTCPCPMTRHTTRHTTRSASRAWSCPTPVREGHGWGCQCGDRPVATLYGIPVATVRDISDYRDEPAVIIKTAADDRITQRQHLEAAGAERGRLAAVSAYSTQRCELGNHAPNGCQASPNNCLCVCHDPAGETL